jgi:hypothetical protein
MWAMMEKISYVFQAHVYLLAFLSLSRKMRQRQRESVIQ